MLHYPVEVSTWYILNMYWTFTSFSFTGWEISSHPGRNLPPKVIGVILLISFDGINPAPVDKQFISISYIPLFTRISYIPGGNIAGLHTPSTSYHLCFVTWIGFQGVSFFRDSHHLFGTRKSCQGSKKPSIKKTMEAYQTSVGSAHCTHFVQDECLWGKHTRMVV